LCLCTGTSSADCPAGTHEVAGTGSTVNPKGRQTQSSAPSRTHLTRFSMVIAKQKSSRPQPCSKSCYWVGVVCRSFASRHSEGILSLKIGVFKRIGHLCSCGSPPSAYKIQRLIRKRTKNHPKLSMSPNLVRVSTKRRVWQPCDCRRYNGNVPHILDVMRVCTMTLSILDRRSNIWSPSQILHR